MEKINLKLKTRSKSALSLTVTPSQPPNEKSPPKERDQTIQSRLKQEYETIEKEAKAPKTTEELFTCCPSALSIENLTKNRYKNVLPAEETRVKLKTMSAGHSDYINASYIVSPTFGSRLKFITGQAPTPNTFNDFWRMIWEQKTGVIVMLTRLYEGFKRKADKYWPKKEMTMEYGSFVVTCSAVHKLDLIKVRVFTVVHGEEKREITQLHYKEWPDFGVPVNSSKMKELIKKIDIYKKFSDSKEVNGPVLVHCSAGLGRSGTLIAIMFAYEQLINKTPLEAIDFQGIVFHLRKQRPGMIQSFDQYLFFHKVVQDLDTELQRRSFRKKSSFQYREASEEIEAF